MVQLHLSCLMLSLLAGMVLGLQGPCDPQAMLQKHNSLRALHGAPPLVWDENLVALEKGWITKNAPSWAQTGMPIHSNESPENLFMSYGGSGDMCSQAVQSWYDEIANYNWNNPESHTDFVGHFTMVVWVNTRKVGCYQWQLNGVSVVGCAYDTGNAFYGKYIKENVQPVGSPMATRKDLGTVDYNDGLCKFYTATFDNACFGFVDDNSGQPAVHACPVSCAPILAARHQKWLAAALAAGPDDITPPAIATPPTTPPVTPPTTPPATPPANLPITLPINPLTIPVQPPIRTRRNRIGSTSRRLM